MSDDPINDNLVDPDERSEVLDSDKLGTPDDTMIPPDYPYDELLGADDYGITAAEEHVGEPLAERVERERPEPLAEELQRGADAASSDAPVRPGGQGERAEDGVGRLVEPGVGDDVGRVDEEGEAIARAVDQRDLSAEEAAVNPTEDPPMGTLGGDYV